MVDSGTELCLSKVQYSVYSCIVYFHIFKYPARTEEILTFVNTRLSEQELNEVLEDLIALQLIFSRDGFYFPEKNMDAAILKRKNSEKRLKEKMKTISRYARLISAFPYVKSVSISGSCSKGLLDVEGDVDYFIIAAPGRLWLCRTLLIAFKKIFLLNSKKYFCVNYFVDADNLLIPDKNLFVAYEIKTLAPVNNFRLFSEFVAANGWTNSFFPNKQQHNGTFLRKEDGQKFFARFIESVFNTRLGSVAERFCFDLTLSTWKKRYPGFNKEEFELNFRSRKNVSKHHPRGFQLKVLEEFTKKLGNVKVSS